MKILKTNAPETDDVGLANNDIDGFLKDLLQSVSREPTQNSNDEALKRPVKMVLNLHKIPVAEIPDIENYKDVIERCLQEANDSKAKKAEEFFENAKALLGEKKVKILSISDSGTRGAGGEFKKGGKFFTLVVSEGRTDKDNLYSAGSFGIGKNASFAGSALRLVFYSSVYRESGDAKFYCMGKSVLTSWRNSNDENMSHKVFFGEDDESLTPVRSMAPLPDWLKKNEQGLKVTIVAPRIELKEGWTEGFIASLLSNFFLALFDGDLEFSLDDERVVINNSTMLDYFDDPLVIEAAESAAQTEKLELAKSCSLGLAADEFIIDSIDVKHLGQFELMIKVGEGLPKKVCFIRNGMFITTTLNHFARPLKRFPNTKEFIVIVRPKNIEDKSSEMIKRMENPEHNELTTGYIADEAEAKRLKAAMQNLESKVRAFIQEHAKMEVLETRDIEELKEYFQSPGDKASVNSESEEEDPTLVITHRGKSRRRGSATTLGGKLGGKGRRGKKTKGKKKRKGPGTGGSGQYKEIQLPCRALKSASSSWRLELSDIPESGEISLWPLERSRGVETRSVQIKACSGAGAKISPDKLSVSLTVASGSRHLLDLDLDSDASVIDWRPTLKSAKGTSNAI